MKQNPYLLIKNADPNKVLNIMRVLADAGPAEEAILETYASLSPKSRREFIRYWKNIFGREYARDLAKDYMNIGKPLKPNRNKKKLDKSALLSSKSSSNKVVENYWDSLLGKEYANLMVSYPFVDNAGKKSSKKKDW